MSLHGAAERVKTPNKGNTNLICCSDDWVPGMIEVEKTTFLVDRLFVFQRILFTGEVARLRRVDNPLLC